MDAIVARYRERTPRSAALAERAERVMPGGDTRAVTHHAPYPLTFASGAGPWLEDVDGHRYLDLLGNYTSLVHGNAYPPIVAAATQAVAGGTAWAARNQSQVALAELLVERVAAVERVRFTNSGTEAAMLALHLARAATGRTDLLMARGGYHGSQGDTEAGTHHDQPQRLAPGDGARTHLADYGDLASFEAALAEHGEWIAAVLIEPVLGSGGTVAAPDGFLRGLAAAAHRAGALLIADEVISFRLATGGAQQLHGVAPDLTMFGKIIGGGFPVGAVGGSESLLALSDPRRGRLNLSGTFNGNPVTTAAGRVSVAELTGDRIARLDVLGARLADGLHDAATAAGLPLTVTRAGSLATLWFSERDWAGRHDRPDAALVAAFHLAAAVHGVHCAPRGMLVLSTVMGEAEVDLAVDRLGAAMADAAATVDTPAAA